MPSLILEHGKVKLKLGENSWFDATLIGLRFHRRPIDWLVQNSTKKLISTISRRYRINPKRLVHTSRGGTLTSRGTWFHPSLAIAYARWLDPSISLKDSSNDPIRHIN